MLKAFCELNEAGTKIEVHFRYSREAVAAIKYDAASGMGVPGAKFVPKDKGGPFWTVPADLDAARRLRDAFGVGLTLGDAVKAWGRTEAQRRRNLDTLTTADDAVLTRVPDKLLAVIKGEVIEGLPKPFNKVRPERPYQRADISFMAQTNTMNTNQPGTGKTLEVIGALWEADLMMAGPHIVVAPRRSLKNVWATEFKRWSPLPVFTAEDPKARKAAVAEGLKLAKAGKPCVICVIADDVRAMETKGANQPVIYTDHKGKQFSPKTELQFALMNVNWASVTIDEFHKMGLNNRRTLLHIGLSQIKGQRRFALSGTPMGGKPRKLWPVLNWLEPEFYTSFWRWADMWLDVDDNGYGKVVGGIKPGREEEFYKSHARHMIRRLKRDALPGLPVQVHVIVSCPMTAKQRKTYNSFAAMAEVNLDGGRVSAQNILAEYTRLKQFANAQCVVNDKGEVIPTSESGKLDQLMEKLDGEGIRKEDPEPGSRAIVASESKRFVDMLVSYLRDQGVACDALTGDTKDSEPLVERFQNEDPEPYVIVMTTQTGGVSLNLEAAGSVHALDETWNPDNMEQLFDRADRGSRDTSLRCYTYRTEESIQEYIAEVAEDKRVTNANVLDVVREANKRKKESK